MNYTITKNPQFNSLEILFEGKPSDAVRSALKELKFRWHSVKKVWYGYAEEDAARTAIEKAEQPLVIPESKEVDPGTMYSGFEGGNYHKWNTEKELKACIIADMKKAGIAGSVRFNRAGYLTSLTVTIKITEADIKSIDEWGKDYHVTAGYWHYYTNADGKICDIYGEKFYELSGDEQQTMLENIKETEYKLERSRLTQNNVCFGYDDVAILTESGNKILSTVQMIVSSYNRDCSNSMIDYFDRSIYDHYSFKVA